MSVCGADEVGAVWKGRFAQSRASGNVWKCLFVYSFIYSLFIYLLFTFKDKQSALRTFLVTHDLSALCSALFGNLSTLCALKSIKRSKRTVRIPEPSFQSPSDISPPLVFHVNESPYCIYSGFFFVDVALIRSLRLWKSYGHR